LGGNYLGSLEDLVNFASNYAQTVNHTDKLFFTITCAIALICSNILTGIALSYPTTTLRFALIQLLLVDNGVIQSEPA
jgi:hypothetical protein